MKIDMQTKKPFWEDAKLGLLSLLRHLTVIFPFGCT